MSVYKNAGSWRAEVYIRSVRVDSKHGFKTRTAAKKWHDQRKHELAGIDPKRLLDGSRLSFDDLLLQFERKHVASLGSPNTRKRYLREIRLRIKPFFEYRPLSKIDADLIEEYRDSLQKTPQIANKSMDVLRLIFLKGVEWKFLERSPYPSGLKSLAEEATEVAWWDDKKDIETFLALAKRKTRHYPLYLLGLETGMRPSELIALWKGDVDFERGRIHVQRQWDSAEKSYRLPKHGKKRWIDFDPSSELATVLRQAAEKSPHPKLVFPSRRGGPINYRGVLRRFSELCERAKVRQLGLHGLRHTFASWYMLVHDDIWSLSALLGHATLTVTIRSYAHHSQRARRKPLPLSQMLCTQGFTQSGTTTTDNSPGQLH